MVNKENKAPVVQRMKYDLVLRHVGPLYEARVQVGGLTLIVGANDTGKSTVGKSLMALIKTDSIARARVRQSSTPDWMKTLDQVFEMQLGLHFGHAWRRRGAGEEESTITLNMMPEESWADDSLSVSASPLYRIRLPARRPLQFDCAPDLEHECPYFDVMLVSTPLVWDLMDFFRSVAAQALAPGEGQSLRYPYTLWDVYRKLEMRSECMECIDPTGEIASIIGGGLRRQDNGDYVWSPDRGGNYPLTATAAGVKWFGLWQALGKAGALHSGRFIIIDEPENHLHPRWQVECARLLVTLASRGLSLMVTSHSPYFIEGVEVWSRRLRQPVDWRRAWRDEDTGAAFIDQMAQEELGQMYEDLAAAYDRLERLRAGLE